MTALILCLQLIWSTALELAAATLPAQRGVGSKQLQHSIDAALTGGTHKSSVCSLWKHPVLHHKDCSMQYRLYVYAVLRPGVAT